MQVRFRRIDWEFAVAFRTASRTRTHAETVLLELQAGEFVGRGEAAGVPYHRETAEIVIEQLAAIANELAHDISRTQLQRLLPPGGARNAVDCALWDLESKRSGRRAWQLAGFSSVQPLLTAYTLSADTPAAMAKAAAAAGERSMLKVKLLGEGDLERVARVRDSRPDARIIVDANQSWDEQALRDLPSHLAALGVELIEQPLPVGRDDVLSGFTCPIPLCADESCQTSESLSNLPGKYQFVNIKLDKTGGLTEALCVARRARELGLGLMVGSMGGSSLSMAPAFVVGQLCQIADLDGPLLIKSDVPHAMQYSDSWVLPPEAPLWG